MKLSKFTANDVVKILKEINHRAELHHSDLFETTYVIKANDCSVVISVLYETVRDLCNIHLNSTYAL